MFDLQSLEVFDSGVEFSVKETLFKGSNGFKFFNQFVVTFADASVVTLVFANGKDASDEYDFFDVELAAEAFSQFMEMVSGQGFTYLSNGDVVVMHHVLNENGRMNNPMEFESFFAESMQDANEYLAQLVPAY